MSRQVIVAGTLIVCASFVSYSALSKSQAADVDVQAETSTSESRTSEDAARDDMTMATRIALMLHEEIGWNEFGTARVVDPEVQKYAQQLIDERQRLLNDLKAFAPDATRDTFLNKTAKDARLTGTNVARVDAGLTRRRISRSNARRQESVIDRLAQPSRLDRASAEAARIASYKGNVGAALRNSTGLQSPHINPPLDNLITNPGGILPGVTEGGSLNPPLIAIKAPMANSAAADGVGGMAQAAASAGSFQGVSNAGAPGKSGAVNANSPSGLMSGPAAGANGAGTAAAGNGPSGLFSGPAAGTQGPQAGVTSSTNPTGLLSGPAAGVPGPQSGNVGSTNPTGLMSGPAASVPGPQSGTTASTNPTGLLSGPAAGANSNTAVGAAANGPTGLLSGPGAAVQVPQANSTTSQNPTGLLTGPAAGTQGPQSGTTSSQNPTGLLSGPAAGVQNPTATNTTSQNPTGLLSGPAAGTPGPSSGNTTSQNPTGLLSGPGAGDQPPQSNATTSQNPTGLLSGPAAGTQGPQSGTTSSQNPTGLLSGPAAGVPTPTVNSNASQTANNSNLNSNNNTNTAAAKGANALGSATGNGSDAVVPDGVVPNIDADGNVLPGLGLIGTGGVGATQGVGEIGQDANIAIDGAPAAVPNGNSEPATGRNSIGGNAAAPQGRRSGTSDTARSETARSAERRAALIDNTNSAERDFDVLQVERQLAVQSLAGSKLLIEKIDASEIDRAFLRQEFALQKELLGKLVVYQQFASHDLKKVLEESEQKVIRSLETTQELLSQQSSSK